MIDDKIMSSINGGAVTGNLLNSIARMIGILLDLGRSIGSSIRMYKNKKYQC